MLSKINMGSNFEEQATLSCLGGECEVEPFPFKKKNTWEQFEEKKER